MKTITEESGEHKEWYADKKLTLKDLPAFLSHLMNDYRHDYGTICHALAAGAVQTVRAMNRHDNGGITGFQAGAVMWNFVRVWMSKDGPMRLVEFDDMLYPQHEDLFEKTINEETWTYLREQARKLLRGKQSAHPEVKAHWQSIAAGVVPFGYTVSE